MNKQKLIRQGIAAALVSVVGFSGLGFAGQQKKEENPFLASLKQKSTASGALIPASQPVGKGSQAGGRGPQLSDDVATLQGQVRTLTGELATAKRAVEQARQQAQQAEGLIGALVGEREVFTLKFGLGISISADSAGSQLNPVSTTILTRYVQNTAEGDKTEGTIQGTYFTFKADDADDDDAEEPLATTPFLMPTDTTKDNLKKVVRDLKAANTACRAARDIPAYITKITRILGTTIGDTGEESLTTNQFTVLAARGCIKAITLGLENALKAKSED